MQLEGGNGNSNDPLTPLRTAINIMILGIQVLLLCPPNNACTIENDVIRFFQLDREAESLP
jgi:hypothetical protein